MKKKKTEKKKEEKKPEPKSDSLFTKKSEAGKGDAPRIGISQDEWEKKWESILSKGGVSTWAGEMSRIRAS